jgi:hypothetical protein
MAARACRAVSVISARTVACRPVFRNVDQLVGHDLRGADQPMQHWFIQDDDQVRGKLSG